MATNPDELTAVKTDENTATTNENSVVNTNENTATPSTNESTATASANDNPVGSEKDDKPTPSDTATKMDETQSSPQVPTETPVSNETTNAASVDQPITIDTSVDDKATEIQPLTTPVPNLNEPPSFDLPSTNSSASNKGVDLNFSPPIDTPEFHATTSSPPLINTVNNSTTFPTTRTDINIINEPNNVQVPQPSATFSIGDDTPSLSLTTPDIAPASDTTTLERVEDPKSAEPPISLTSSTPQKSPAITSNQQGSFVSYISESPDKLVLFAIVLAVSRKLQYLTNSPIQDILIFLVLQLIIGRVYKDDCSDYPGIPRYLAIAGFIGLITFITCILYTLLRYFARSTSTNTSFIFLRGPFIVTILSIILLIITVVWWIRGSIWVFSVWKQVQYIERVQANYCHPVTYRTAFWTLLITIICAGIFLISIIQQIRRLSVDRKKGPATLVPTSEP